VKAPKGLARRLLVSVRVRVTAVALLAVACVLAASAALVYGSLVHYRQRILMNTAEADAREVTDLNPGFQMPLSLPRDPSLESGLVQVLRNGKVIGYSHLLRGEAPLWLPGEPMVQQDSTVLGGPGKVVVAVPVSSGSARAIVVVVTSLDQYNNSVSVVQRLLEIGMPLFLILVGVICWMIVGRALRPIERMRREVAEVATTQRAHRIREPATNDEVGRLARTLNSMLDRIEASSRRERRFVSDASHELRSPLANIRTEIEVALHHPGRADWPDVAKDVLAQNERMGQLVEELLLLARSDEGGLMPAAEPTDLAKVVEETVAPWFGRFPEVVVDAAAAPVAVPAGYIERMVSNLVGNARRFARTRVVVTVRPEGAMGVLTVQDDGPGVPESERTRIFERFVRLDEARYRGEGGFGLGLAIVADLCRSYGGTITVGDAGPGAVFTLSLPLSGGGLWPEPIKEPAAV
jgi:signal transduction histidine kinase